ncbi:aldehyde dehydrogenase [Lineolata rhizophorae]|uniref:aldehyde dehydrogenase (NAD(+)) n=1 Tax=Lineolata rhizophorae TaxID=578093 RepID=A0A6A6P0Q1_9PEZI|nr:aldehyde dehydrogenase [Lineolata rhizophorae]
MTLPKFETKLFLNNEYVDAKSGETLTVVNPHNNDVITDKIQVAGEADIDLAVDYAEAAFKEWRKVPSAQRSEPMKKFAQLLSSYSEDYSKLETASMGMPGMLGSMVGQLAVACFNYYAGWTDKIAGDTFPEEDGAYKIVRHEPLGVCAGIGAWNVPLMLFCYKVAPAVAAGNSIIFKTSERAPLAVLQLGHLIKEAGFPPGLIQLVSGAGPTGGLLASHMRIRKISFTGSVATGKKVKEMATKSNLKRVTLELGGKSPALVFDDANFETAVAQCAQGVLINSGEACVATSRTFVQESVAQKFIAALKTAFESTGSGMGSDPALPSTTFGPLVDQKHSDIVMSFIESGKKDAEILTGGSRKSNYVEPTIFLNPKEDSRIYRDEIFGPVMSIKTFKTEEEAIKLANDTSYGLFSAIFTTNLNRALRVSSAVEAGTVAVNSSFMPSLIAPFGGWKQSGYGREAGKDGMMSYLETKTILINMNG